MKTPVAYSWPSRALLEETTANNVFSNSLKLVSDEARLRISISKKSLYGDDIWDFTSEFPDLTPFSVIINFASIDFSDGTNITGPGNEHYLSSLKEYCHSLIVDPPHKYPKWSTCCRSLRKGIRTLLRYMKKRQIYSFSKLGRFELEDFLMSVAVMPNETGRPVSNRTLRARVYGLSWLYEQSAKILDGLTIWPYGEFSTEAEWVAMFAQKNIARTEGVTREMPDAVAKVIVSKAIEDLNSIDKIRAIDTILEQTKGRPKRKTLITQTISTRISVFPGKAFGVNSYAEYRKLVVRVRAACYILIALLSGMRFHEIAHMKAGRGNHWHEETIHTDGGIRTFYFLVSKTNKLQARPSAYRWQTVPFIKQVLDVLEICNHQRIAAGNPYLFSAASGKTRVGISVINRSLKDYVAYHDIKHSGSLWPLATHQFRKKFSRIMIRQGLGLVALQDQLKHFDIEMTKGYGDINLYAELQQDKFLLSSEKYDELLSNQTPIIGGGAADILNMRTAFMGMTTSERKVFLSDLPRKASIEQMDDGLCMYRPAKALCGGESHNCRPADCNNAILPAISMKKTLYWRRSENQRMMVFFQKDPFKAAYLETRIVEIEKLLSQLDSLEVKHGTLG